MLRADDLVVPVSLANDETGFALRSRGTHHACRSTVCAQSMRRLLTYPSRFIIVRVILAAKAPANVRQTPAANT